MTCDVCGKHYKTQYIYYPGKCWRCVAKTQTQMKKAAKIERITKIKNGDIIDKVATLESKIARENLTHDEALAHRKSRTQHWAGAHFYRILTRAGDKFKMSWKEFRGMVDNNKKCYYCDGALSQSISIDRKYPGADYSLDNCVVACNVCNTMKWNILSEQEMKAIATFFKSTYGKHLSELKTSG